jgi:SdpI/YhfL family protein
MEAIGPILVVLSIPLILRWIPQNRFYGLRIPATYRNKSVWYDVNALHGRHILLLGLLMVTLEFLLPLSMRTPVLATIGFIGLGAIVAVDWRTANRWRREREGDSLHQ